MEENVKNMRLREWLIAQIDSKKYAGLSWENQEKNMFRIPWKHAAKQDYRQNEDAALFKAWAVYKGKYREGRDKADPSTWKTRLRCALNKSTDFQEVAERSQLDISEPYKVYRILAESYRPAESSASPLILQTSHPGTPLRGPLHLQFVSEGESDRDMEVGSDSSERLVEGKFHPWTGTGVPGYDSSAPLSGPLSPAVLHIIDFRLQVCVLYLGQPVQEVVSSSSDGCFILQGSAPVGSERIYGPCAAESVFFPPPGVVRLPPGITEAMSRLLPHLEKGVLVWVAPDGVFIKRFCQGRVYWDGPLAEHRDQPNKLERERTCKLLDMPIFLQELQLFLRGIGPRPRYEIDLCFGEEFPDASQPKSRKLITAQVVPLFAKELLLRLQRSESEAGQRHHTPKSQPEDKGQST